MFEHRNAAGLQLSSDQLILVRRIERLVLIGMRNRAGENLEGVLLAAAGCMLERPYHV